MKKLYLITLLLSSLNIDTYAQLVPIREYVNEGYVPYINDLLFSPNGKFVVAGGSHSTVWNAETGEFIRKFSAETEIGRYEIRDMVFSNDGQYLIAGREGAYVDLWNFETFEIYKSFGPYEIDQNEVDNYNPFYTRYVAISPDNQWVIAQSTHHYDTFDLWNVESQEIVHQFPAQNGQDAVAFSPNQKYLTLGNILYDFETKENIFNFSPTGRSFVMSIKFNNNSNEMLLFLFNEIFTGASRWDLNNLETINIYKGSYPKQNGNEIYLSPNEEKVATYIWDDETKSYGVGVWNIDNEEMLGKLTKAYIDEYHQQFYEITDPRRLDYSFYFAYHPTKDQIITNAPNGHLYLWDVNDIINTQSNVDNFDEMK